MCCIDAIGCFLIFFQMFIFYDNSFENFMENSRPILRKVLILQGEVVFRVVERGLN
jgi:hypothetical protein